jgi:very-short-patch-repair endonuclease
MSFPSPIGRRSIICKTQCEFTSAPSPARRAGEGWVGAEFQIICRMRDPVAQYRSRTLRNHATDAERHLWQHLRRRQLGGHRFRRQVPIFGYIADFACLDAKLVIELDGGQHQQHSSYDERRDRRIEARGFRVLRFWDNQVFQETSAVLDIILRALESNSPHPNLPPHTEEGN